MKLVSKLVHLRVPSMRIRSRRSEHVWTRSLTTRILSIPSPAHQHEGQDKEGKGDAPLPSFNQTHLYPTVVFNSGAHSASPANVVWSNNASPQSLHHRAHEQAHRKMHDGLQVHDSGEERPVLRSKWDGRVAHRQAIVVLRHAHQPTA